MQWQNFIIIEVQINMNKTEKINFARVPDEEYVIKKAYNVPTVDDILKLMNKFSGKTSPTEFLSDVFLNAEPSQFQISLTRQNILNVRKNTSIL